MPDVTRERIHAAIRQAVRRGSLCSPADTAGLETVARRCIEDLALLAGEGTAQPDPSETGACGHPVGWNDPHMRHQAPCEAVNWPENCNADACSCERICLACCTRCGPQTVVAHYLVAAPEQGDWEWEDHCDGMAGGIVDALRSAGHLPSLGEVGDGAF